MYHSNYGRKIFCLLLILLARISVVVMAFQGGIIAPIGWTLLGWWFMPITTLLFNILGPFNTIQWIIVVLMDLVIQWGLEFYRKESSNG